MSGSVATWLLVVNKLPPDKQNKEVNEMLRRLFAQHVYNEMPAYSPKTYGHLHDLWMDAWDMSDPQMQEIVETRFSGMSEKRMYQVGLTPTQIAFDSEFSVPLMWSRIEHHHNVPYDVQKHTYKHIYTNKVKKRKRKRK